MGERVGREKEIKKLKPRLSLIVGRDTLRPGQFTVFVRSICEVLGRRIDTAEGRGLIFTALDPELSVEIFLKRVPDAEKINLEKPQILTELEPAAMLGGWLKEN